MRDQFPAHGPIEKHVHHLANVTLTPAGKWQTFDPQFDSERFYVRDGAISPFGPDLRSEEHTSELQSQSNLVCRLLLEKKKTKKSVKQHTSFSIYPTFQLRFTIPYSRATHQLVTNYTAVSLALRCPTVLACSAQVV